GLTREMIIPEKIDTQEEIQKVDIPEFYANKRTIGIATILNEITNNYLNKNVIWTYYNRDQTLSIQTAEKYQRTYGRIETMDIEPTQTKKYAYNKSYTKELHFLQPNDKIL
ncbi:hypothetical protein, partial [Acinetobacter baumannii]|uniref:hypothetical protein n=1 Tax=Acinetobacter baumannii TaxID=470 RepID=UPI003391C5B4